MIHVGEVDAAHHVQRLIVVGIESEVLQQQLAADDAYGVVVEAHADAVRDADEVGRVDIHLAVDVGMAGSAPDGHAAFCIAVETDDLVGHEAVDERQRGACHVERGVDETFILVLVGASEQAELLAVEHQAGFDGVGVVLLLQVHKLGAQVADVGTLVGHACHRHVRGHGDMLILVLQDVVVTVELAGDARQVGDDGRQLSQVDMVQADGEVLEHRGVLVLGVDLHTRLVVGDEVYLRLYLLVARQEDVVVGIEVKLLVADGGSLGHQPEAQASWLHLGRGPDPDAHPPLVVIVAQSCQCPMLVEVSVDEGVEHELWVLAVVAYLPLVGEPLTLLPQAQPDGVDADAVVVEREEVALAVDACQRRGGEVEGQLLEVGACGHEQVRQGVVALALHVQAHRRQQRLDGRLVDDLVAELLADGVGEHTHLAEQPLIAARGVELQDEVAALDAGVGGVGIGLHEDAHVAGGVGLAGISDGEVVQPAADVVAVFHVGAHLQAAVGADGERIAYQSHLIEVGLGEVGADGSLYPVGVEQQVGADAALEELVVTVDVKLSSSVGEDGCCRELVQVQVAVL